MKAVSSKRKDRLENKKRKMAALVNITQLNEYDRANNKTKMARLEETSTIIEDSNQTKPEPSTKKVKISHNTEKSPCDPGPPLIGDLGPSGKPKLNGAEFSELKKMLRNKTNRIRQQPCFRLRDMGENASVALDLELRMPLFLSDLQHLIMYSQIGPHSPYSPARWCALDKYNKLANFNLLIVENVSLYHFSAHESMFPNLNNFTHQLEVVTPKAYMSDIVRDLSMVPLTGTQMKKFVDKFGTLESAVTQSTEVFDTLKNSFPIERTEEDADQHNGNVAVADKFSRTKLLLSGWQMVEENFPLPIKGLMERKYRGYVLTKDLYGDVTPSSPMYALDCEMCRTSTGDLELTRVSVVDENLKTFYDTLVKPDNKIVDYLTQYSGINAKMMKNVTKKLADVQQDLRRLLPKDAIIVGQSLSNDFHALKMMHPYVIDTSVIFNLTGDRTRKTKLQTLTREFLRERIQESKKGHCSTEDSLACMKLTQLKLKKSVFYGDAVMGGGNDVRAYPDMATSQYATSMLRQCAKMDSTVHVAGVDELAAKYRFYVDKNAEGRGDGQITFASAHTNDGVVEDLCRNAGKHNVNIGHVRVSDGDLCDISRSETFRVIDNWTKKLNDSCKMPSLNVVLLGGHQDSGNGVCFMFLKKEFIK
ncbi:unnamed protein product [Brassicogethes aeneus]|uniref:Exonuclease domain-containing protein n=1 Tax=Brassicogethes aeneus TaxID=1431903 RepID=A0A9P0AQG9_BRAAE|nr:unnamed protein product [Brassicogethes aeneus]